MHSLSGEDQLAAVQVGAAEIMIEKCASVAVSFTVARDESRHSSFIFHRDLDKLSILQKAVHPGIFVALPGLLRGRCVLRFWSSGLGVLRPRQNECNSAENRGDEKSL